MAALTVPAEAQRRGDMPASAAPTSVAATRTSPANSAPTNPAPAKPAPASSAPADAQSDAGAAPMTGPQIIQLLDQAIGWYRLLGVQQQAATEPSDLLILYDNRQAANRVVALAFDIARSNAELLTDQPSAGDAAAAGPSPQSLQQLQAKFTAQEVATQAELQTDQQKLGGIRGKQSPQAIDLKAKISELQAELDLIAARKNLLTTLLSVNSDQNGDGVNKSALKAQIDAMAVTVPAGAAASASSGSAAGAVPQAAGAAAAGASSSGPATPLAGASVNSASRFGIWDLASNVFRLSEKLATIKNLDKDTAQLQQTFARIRTPLGDQLKALSSSGDALATQADTADAAALTRTRGQLDALVNQFKQSSAQLIPLNRLDVLLTQYRRNLGNWRDLVLHQYKNALATLGIRVGVLVALLALVFLAAELWRRAVTRYVHDYRRQYQLMLLRRIALWSVVAIIVGFAFASELTSIVTFAGLITAGIAVAMQSVLVSIVGYFFLIGKYGIRVGDRVQIGDVSGEVIEVGLIRLHLLELGNHGLSGPTGRVVAFANSIAFQVSSGLFKQISGVDFAWHEITLQLPAGVDYGSIKQQLLAAVHAGLKDSREEILRQTREIERTTASNAAGDGEPRVQLSYTPAGVEAHVHYPVHLRNAAEIDESVSQELMRVLTQLKATKPAAAAGS